jgi:hypothetical protein
MIALQDTVLHVIGDWLRDVFARLPLPVVRGLFLALPIVLLVWVLRLPRAVTTPPEGAQRWDENLKLWAGIALVIQILVYSLF